MLFSWLANKLFKRGRDSHETNAYQSRMASDETGQPFDGSGPERATSRKRRRRRGRSSAVDAGAAGVAGAFFVAPPADHGHDHGHGGFDGGGGDAGGGF